MTRKCEAPSILILILFSAFANGFPAQSARPKLKPVLRQVDHILIQAGDARMLFDFFAETLQLPVAWPIADYAGFASGGVNAGNVNIEVLRFAGQGGAPPARRPAARFIGLALEPLWLEDCLAELQVRGVRHDQPEPYISRLPDGSQGALWTNVSLLSLSKPGLSVFLCEYSPAFLHAEIRRNQLGGQLALKKGGPLGIRSVKEIVIGTTDLTADRLEWEKMSIAAAGSSAAPWPIGNGPALRLVAGSANRILRIVFKVAALKPARDFLSENHLLGAVSTEELAIEPAKIQGLGIRLVEK